MSEYRRSVEALLGSIQVHSATSWSWFGDRVDELTAETVAAMDAPTARAYLVNDIEGCLYANYYCPGTATPFSDEPPGGSLTPRWSPFMGALSAANGGKGSSEPGWVVCSVDHGELVVEHEGLRVWVEPSDVQVEAGGEMTPGAAVRVRLPKELRKLSPGFYVALGDEGIGPDPADPLIRVYWNLAPEAAPQFVGVATRLLNQADVPFQLKVLSDPERYDRCDAGVIYTKRRDYPAAAVPAKAVFEEVAWGLNPTPPALTKRLAPGVALAEDPGGGESYGMRRCHLLAEGVARAYEEGGATVADRLDAVVACFTDAGIDLDAPYLDACSQDLYPAWS